MVDEDILFKMWACVAQDSSFKLRERNKHIVMFAPDGTKYKALKSKLKHCVFEPVDMSKGLRDIDFNDIIRIIAS